MMKNILLAFVFAAFVTSAPAYAAPLKIKKCQICHGKQLTGKKKNPSIVGLPYEKLYASLTTDIPKKMNRLAKKLTDEQKIELSKYIFTLRVD
tara:strand:+ start:45 stop:323 length:279 start_codon:yes stop_codon:yes gene_type:complete